MDITISLPPEKQPELEKQAAAAGTDVASFVAQIVQQSLDEQSDATTAADLPNEQRIRVSPRHPPDPRPF